MKFQLLNNQIFNYINSKKDGMQYDLSSDKIDQNYQLKIKKLLTIDNITLLDECSDNNDDILKKYLNNNACNFNCTFYNSGNAAMLTLLVLFKNHNFNNVIILRPFYSPVEDLCITLNIPYKILDLRYENNQFYIPRDLILSYIKNNQIIYITNPIFSTGMYYNENDVIFLKNILKKYNVQIICDELISNSKNLLLQKIQNNDNVFYIISPHKSIGIENKKLVCAIHSQKFNNELLTLSSIILGTELKFKFIKKTYLNIINCQKIYINYIMINQIKLNKILKKCKWIEKIHSNMIDTTYMSVKVTKSVSNYLKFFKYIIDNKIIIYPQILNSNILTFRINLLKNINSLNYALLKLDMLIANYND